MKEPLNKSPLAALLGSVIVAVAQMLGYKYVSDEAAYTVAVALLALAAYLYNKFGVRKSTTQS